MSSSQWDNPDGVTPWRSAGPAPQGELFVAPSPDPSVADALLFSSVPVAVHLRPPPSGQATPHLVVQPLDATSSSPARRVRVSLVTSATPSSDEEVLRWDQDDFDARRALGEAIRRFAERLR